MRKKGLLFTNMIILLFIFSFSIVEAPPLESFPFVVHGYVEDEHGNPFQGVSFSIKNISTNENLYTTSNERGYYGIVFNYGVSAGNVIRVTAQHGTDQKVIDHTLTEQEADSAGVMINIVFDESVQTITPLPTTTPAPSQPPTTPPRTTVPPTSPATTIPPNNNVTTTNPPTTEPPPDTTLPPNLTKEPISTSPTTTTSIPTVTQPPTNYTTTTAPPMPDNGEENGDNNYLFYIAVACVAIFGIYVLFEVRK